MKYIIDFAGKASGIIGWLCLFCAVGTSDYYLMELNRPEPASVNRLLVIGLLLLIPSIIHMIHRKAGR